MKFTQEQFEHYLSKVKTLVGPDHRSIAFNGMYLCGGSGTCIVGFIVQLASGAMCNRGEWYTTVVSCPLAYRAASMNDAGMPWHQIVDTLVPPTAIEARDIAEAEELVIEPTVEEQRKGCEPVSVPVARVMEKLGEGART